MSSAKRKWLRRALIVVAFVIALVPAFLYIYWPDHKLQRDAQTLLGQSEAAVIAKMGAPITVVTAADIAAHPTEVWWGSGWHPAPTRPVTNKVLLYYAVVVGAIVYVGPAGVVEHVHLVGT